ncbi:hypothetical protein QUF90_21000 [Desulfococcaceae bacterium HSG9]|nr:hypothetical protein [Desulfococcaceae bacterium HSG9]
MTLCFVSSLEELPIPRNQFDLAALEKILADFATKDTHQNTSE